MESTSKAGHSAHKEIACTFLRLVSSGRVGEAYELYVSKDFMHHNPYFGGDARSLRQGMEENARTFPAKVFEILRALAEGDLVAVHSRVRLAADKPVYSLVHLFRFQNERIVEFWDVGQPVPDDAVNEYGMF